MTDAEFEDATIYDPFAGSGSALIAAEKTGRACRAIDLDPRYVQTVIDRWQAYTGQRAERMEGGGCE